MAVLVHPQSELIREPRLLVPKTKPLGPVRVDRSHAIGKLVRLCLPLTPASGFFDIAGKKQATVTGNPIPGVYLGSYGIDFNGSSDGLSYPLDISNLSSVTVITRINFDTTGLRILWEHTPAWDGYAGGLACYLDGNPLFGTVGAHRLGADKNARYFANYPSTGKWYDLCITHYPATVAGYEIVIYRDGALLATTQAGSPNNADTSGSYANSTFYIGSRNNAQYWFDGKIEYLYVISSALSADQVLDLMRDPYQFLIPA